VLPDLIRLSFAGIFLIFLSPPLSYLAHSLYTPVLSTQLEESSMMEVTDAQMLVERRRTQNREAQKRRRDKVRAVKEKSARPRLSSQHMDPPRQDLQESPSDIAFLKDSFSQEQSSSSSSALTQNVWGAISMSAQDSSAGSGCLPEVPNQGRSLEGLDSSNSGTEIR
jgi:hypothetical protein